MQVAQIEGLRSYHPSRGGAHFEAAVGCLQKRQIQKKLLIRKSQARTSRFRALELGIFAASEFGVGSFSTIPHARRGEGYCKV